jgi:heterodisulfide reductase subunit A-like polyferredoxin
MAKRYKVKWYDWHAGHYNEEDCTSEQLNPLFSKLHNKTGISDITITEINELKLEN